jgi:hypothetical protein
MISLRVLLLAGVTSIAMTLPGAASRAPSTEAPVVKSTLVQYAQAPDGSRLNDVGYKSTKPKHKKKHHH